MGDHFMFVPDYKGMEPQGNSILQDQKVPKERLPKKLIPQGEISLTDPDPRMHMPLLLEWLLSYKAYSYMYTMHAKTAGGVVSSSCHNPDKRGPTIQKKYPGQTEVPYLYRPYFLGHSSSWVFSCLSLFYINPRF